MEVCPARLGERRAFHRPTARSLRAGPSAFLDDILPPWVGMSSRQGVCGGQGTNEAEGRAAKCFYELRRVRSGKRCPADFSPLPRRGSAPPRARGASRAGARNLGGLEGLGMPSGKALGQTSGQTSGRHASPLRGKARRIGIKKCQPSYMFLSLYQQPLPPFRRAEQHLPGADVHRQNRHVSVSPRKPPAMAVCATSSSNRRKKHRSSLGTSPFGAPFGAHVIGSAPHCRWRTCPRPPPILCTAAAPSPLSLTNQGSPRPCRPHASLSPQLCRQKPPGKPNLPPRTAKSKHRPRHREAGLCSTQNAPGNTPGALPLTV